MHGELPGVRNALGQRLFAHSRVPRRGEGLSLLGPMGGTYDVGKGRSTTG